jgi:hypothetical protein
MNASKQGLLNKIMGKRGENRAYLALTEFLPANKLLFNPAFLGETWPTCDYYVELESVRNARPVFLAQVKTKKTGFDSARGIMRTRVTKSDVHRLSRLPLPTYVIAICETTHRVFIRAVLKGTASGFNVIPAKFEATGQNLQILHQEVKTFWKSANMKPRSSYFL